MKTTTKYIGIALMLALLSLPAYAQMTVQAASATLQPQISRDDTGFTSCGVRALVIDTKKTGFVEAHDFSLTIRADQFAGVLKSGKLRIATADMLKGKLPTKVVTPAPVKFWIAKESKGKAITPKKIIPAETNGFILETADLAETYAGILAIIYGERMQFATRYKNEPLDTVISFSAKMPVHELKPLVACLDDVMKGMLEVLP